MTLTRSEIETASDHLDVVDVRTEKDEILHLDQSLDSFVSL